MSFQAVKFITRENTPPTALVSYETSPGRGGKPSAGARPRLQITIPTTICGTIKAETFQLMVGSGGSAGKIRIKGVAKGAKDSAVAGVRPSEFAHFFRFNFGQVPSLGDDQFEGQRCTVRKISDDEFEIDVPSSWFDLQKDG